MKKHPSHFEDLPNELLADIFKNLDARDLFKAFSNLNTRLNQVIRSFQSLRLAFHLQTANAVKINDELFPFYVHTLTVDPWINFNLHRFPHVRRLTLNSPLPHLLEQLKPELLPSLEYLSVTYLFNMYEITLLHDKIFSNRFPHLLSCELLEKETLMTIQHWQTSPSIRRLRIELIDATIFVVILSACPNLSTLRFAMHSVQIPHLEQAHLNLKRLTVELRDSDWSHDDHILSGFLACVPNVRRLEVHRRHYHADIESYLEGYEWLTSVLAARLPLLRHLHFAVHRIKSEQLLLMFDRQAQRRFQAEFTALHQGSYEARLEFH